MRFAIICFLLIILTLVCNGGARVLHAQYIMPFNPIISPWMIMPPLPFFYPFMSPCFGGFLAPFPVISSPLLIQPSMRMAMAPVTITIPTVTTTTPPLTAILNVIDPTLLASSINFLTANFPLVFNLVVTTFQLPL